MDMEHGRRIMGMVRVVERGLVVMVREYKDVKFTLLLDDDDDDDDDE